MTPGLLEGQEDCLYINVYRPEEKEDEEEQDDNGRTEYDVAVDVDVDAWWVDDQVKSNVSL